MTSLRSERATFPSYNKPPRKQIFESNYLDSGAAEIVARLIKVVSESEDPELADFWLLARFVKLASGTPARRNDRHSTPLSSPFVRTYLSSDSDMEGNQRELEGIISRLGRVRELLVWMEGFFGDGIFTASNGDREALRETNIQEKLQCVNVPNTVVENTSGSKPARTRTHIFNFPNEIISSIFEHGFVFPEHISKKSDPPWSMKVTWVCRRFRQIALDTSCIWSGVSSLLPERVLDLHIERSKEILLSLAIHPNHVPGMGSIHLTPPSGCNSVAYMSVGKAFHCFAISVRAGCRISAREQRGYMCHG